MIQSKKAQVSLEMVIIVGILVLGTIVLATTFINFSNEKVNQSDKINEGIDSTVDGFIKDLNDSSQVEEIDNINPNPGGDDPNPDEPDEPDEPDPENYTLTVNVSGNGTVTSNPPGINCGADCSQNYSSGTSVTLIINRIPGYDFIEWSGACSGSRSTCTVSMTQARNVTATFQSESSEPETYTLTLENETGVSATLSGDGEYQAGENVIVSIKMISSVESNNNIYWVERSTSSRISNQETFTYTMPERNETLVAINE
ncbi:MAG: hypothetical protein PHX47_03630 [Candidatus ainarchaeum sp.]|nr:hypothetical protein [Candidatus ainarchaeum sp.]